MSINAYPVLYLRFRKRVRIPKGHPVMLGDVAQMLTEPELEPVLSKLVLHRLKEEDGNLLLVDMMMVAEKVKNAVPGIRIELFGDPHVLIEAAGNERKSHIALIVLVWLLLFIGSGLTIMNFHEDVSMPEVHRRIYELLTGKRTEHPYLLQIPYSLGIGIGMALFFNHVFKRKFNDEPSPLEVEMFLYQQSLDKYVITEEYGKIEGGKDTEPDGHSRG